MNTTKQEKTIKSLFIGKCWEYLSVNFRKFTQDNKIKIALELCKKNLPQEIEGKGFESKTTIVNIIKTYKEDKIDSSPVRAGTTVREQSSP